MTISRNRLADVLRAGGVLTGAASDGSRATIVEFVEWWGIMPGAEDSCGTVAIKAALLSSGVPWTVENMVLVAK